MLGMSVLFWRSETCEVVNFEDAGSCHFCCHLENCSQEAAVDLEIATHAHSNFPQMIELKNPGI